MNYVVCLKHGNKYSSEYVNKLYRMVKRNLTVEFEFVCFTESRKHIDPEIRVEPLPPTDTPGWWFKPYFFASELPLKGTILYFDLDVIVFENIDNLFDYKRGQFCIIRDFNRSQRPNFDRINSSVFRLETGMFDTLWQQFKQNPPFHMQQNRGEQDWMFRHIKSFTYWPDEWIQSYKWEMRDRRDLKLMDGGRNFTIDAPPTVLPETSVAVFHGEPNPANANDTWVKEHWG